MFRKSFSFALCATALLVGCTQKTPIKSASVESKAVPPPAVAADPALTGADLISVETTPSNRFVLAEKPGEVVVRVHVKGKARNTDKRPPINLALVVDTSGSMEGKAMDDARAASLALVSSLSEGDRLALVVFHSTTEVLVPATILNKQTMGEIREKISAMKASGTTDLGGGLAAGLNEVRKYLTGDGINRVVLLGDGIPNDKSPLPSLAQSAATQHITITSLGLGLDYDETLMSQIALTSGGKYHFINDSAKVAKVFTDEVLRLKAVSARGAVVQFKPGPGVAIKEVIGLPSQPIGNGAQVILGDLSEGDERDVLIRLTTPPRNAGAVVELLDAEVSLTHPQAPGRRISERAFISVKATADASEIEKSKVADVEHIAAKVIVADAIVRSVALARNGDLTNARLLLDGAEKVGKLAAKVHNDNDLAEKVKSIGPLRKTLAALVPPPAPPPPPGGWGGAKPSVAPAAAPVPPADAAVVMATQAAAMRDLQGD
ncbi:MAG: VWA domain-containing protein [Polyangiaceae bacterium]|nr:VWA domain-containing protein [Polyangiaceae bacterium]